MTELDKKKLQRELMQVTAGRLDMEIRIEEMEKQILDVKKHLEIQLAKELELQEKLK